MSDIYRRISVRMWGDASFRGLSAPQPNARDLWIYLLTGPHTTVIPGLFPATVGGLADSLKWPPKAFQSCLAELNPSGAHDPSRKAWFEADWDAGLVWIRGSIRRNEPVAPNVVRSWKPAWSLIPECLLKDKAQGFLEAYAEAKGEGFRKAFSEVFGKAIPKDVAKGIGDESRKSSPIQVERAGRENRDSEGERASARHPGSSHLQAFRDTFAAEAARLGWSPPPELPHSQLRQAAERALRHAEASGKDFATASLALAVAGLQKARAHAQPPGLALLEAEPGQTYQARGAARGSILRPAPAEAFKSTPLSDYFADDPESP